MPVFSDAEDAIDRILALIKRCPEPLQEKCFEVLLSAYAMGAGGEHPIRARVTNTGQDVATKTLSPAAIPDDIRVRFLNVAARLKVDPGKMAALFDFTADPFTFHALAVPGEKKADKTRNVALLLAFKGYLTSGHWTADWKEFKAMCVDQGCYDRGNMAAFLKSAWFKAATAADGVSLSSSGVKEAETLLAKVLGIEE